MSLVRLETGKLYTEKVVCGNEKVMLDLTFPKMMVANTVKFSCFYNGVGSECATCITFPQQIGPVEVNPTIA